MDRHQWIGMTLIAVMLITYTHFFAPELPPQPVTTPAQQGPVAPHAEEAPSQAARLPVAPTAHGTFAPAKQGTAKDIVLENEVIQVTLTSQGGSIKQVVLKNYQDHQGQPLVLLDEASSHMGFQCSVHGQQLNTSALSFETSATNQSVAGTGTAQATFSLALEKGQYIEQTFTLPSQSYTLAHTWKIAGLGTTLAQGPMQFVWHDRIKRTEKDLQACRNKTTINYYLANDKFGHLKERSEKQQEKLLQSPIQWVGIKQRFFTAGIIAQTAFAGGHIATLPTPQSTTTVQEAKVSLTLPSTDPTQDQNGQFTFYFGPNDYATLNKVTKGFTKNISLGWPIVRWINRFLILPVFTFLEQHISNYGLIIILLVLLIKCLLLPLSYKSYVAMAKMRVLKPAIDAIKEKHGTDMQKIQLEQMSLYREMGVNPLSGCIPILLQMPILLAMFNFFPNAIALRQQAFLWASDLSTYDAIFHLPFTIPAYGSHVSLFTLLMTASTILYTWSSNQLMTAQEGPMKIMTYVMPLTFMFILNSFPAGLSFYYCISNLVTFAQQSLIKRVVDEEKIKTKLEANKQKKKPGRFANLAAALKIERENKRENKRKAKH